MNAPTVPERRGFPRRRLLLGLVLALGLGGGGWKLYDIYVRHRLGVITEGQVYKSGAMPPAEMAKVAKDLGLRTVIDLRTYVPGQDPTNTTALDVIQAEAEALKAAGVRHIHLPTAQVPTDATLQRFLEVMADPANRPTLIHCHHGVGRTELFAALWRIEFEGWSNEKARNATRLIVPGSSFSDTSEKGRYLLDYHPRRTGAAPGSPAPVQKP
jgi:protein tyrosine phosphatase (PTP) superfamily phosphohydrolase (DUF442 family)